MDKRTLKALHGSIRKWIRIATWVGEDEGADNCPLCEQFETNFCPGCPVYESGYNGCSGSPYSQWRSAIFVESKGITPVPCRVIGPESQAAAEAEVLFLISLLPEAERARYYEGRKA